MSLSGMHVFKHSVNKDLFFYTQGNIWLKVTFRDLGVRPWSNVELHLRRTKHDKFYV